MEFREWEGRRLRDLRVSQMAILEIGGPRPRLPRPRGEPARGPGPIRPLLASRCDGRDRLAVTHKAVIGRSIRWRFGWSMLGDRRGLGFRPSYLRLAEDGTPSLRQLNLPLENKA
jgi:hypothetical protein